ncbi:MAG: GntR family transcriptional regulator [Cellulosilyticaceae bacterium]
MPDLIAEALIEAILHGKFKGGMQLKQDEIAKQFDVSLIPVREALIQLEGKKLVSCIRNKGTIVSTLSVKEMRELMALRKILEIGSIMVAPELQNEEVLDKMRYMIQKMDLAPDLYSFSRYNRLFYELLCDLAINDQMKATYQNIFVRVERYLMYMYHLMPRQMMHTCDHAEVLECLKAGQKEKVMDTIAKVIENQENQFLAYLENACALEEVNFNLFLPF